jgi:hypothetical protein
MQVTINTNKILLDGEMLNYLKNYCQEQLRIMGANYLPVKFNTLYNKINNEEINKIKKAYENNMQNTLLPISVERFKNTSFYKIKDGRERVIVAFCNNIPQLSVNLENNYSNLNIEKKREKKNKKSNSKKERKKYKKSNSKKSNSKKSNTKKEKKKYNKSNSKKL